MQFVYACNILIEPLTGTIPLTHACPCCGIRSRYHDYDEYDILAERFNIDRAFFYVADRTFAPTSLLAFIDRGDIPLKESASYSNGYQALTVHCFTCNSRFRMRHLRNTGGAVGFCIYCGSTNVGVVQDSEADYWEVLGETYHLPPEMIRSLYEVWETTPIKTFSGFIETMRAQLVEP